MAIEKSEKKYDGRPLFGDNLGRSQILKGVCGCQGYWAHCLAIQFLLYFIMMPLASRNHSFPT